ncbi:rnf12-a, partial [Symbiodinium sp. CCMP2592]
SGAEDICSTAPGGEGEIFPADEAGARQGSCRSLAGRFPSPVGGTSAAARRAIPRAA